MNDQAAIAVDQLSHSYGARQALDQVSLEVAAGEVFAVVGPNGGGKTTLFRILSTLMPPSSGQVSICGHDLRAENDAIRRILGVVFQSPSLDKKLTVAENLRHQGRLYGLSGSVLTERSNELLDQFDIADRRDELVEKLSGGLRRRVELAKGLLHRPRLLLLDEPSTGLDPAARADLWQALLRLRKEDGVTIMLTTHLLDEAERADRVAILDLGKVVALDTPDALKSTVGGDAITIEARDPAALASSIREKFDGEPQLIDGAVRLEHPDGHQWITRLVEAFPGSIDSVMFSRPTLEDVFVARTGHSFENEQE